MLSLRPPVKSEAQLKAIASSGMAGTTKARAELARRTLAGLAQAVKPDDMASRDLSPTVGGAGR